LQAAGVALGLQELNLPIKTSLQEECLAEIGVDAAAELPKVHVEGRFDE
jgi:hypothetical protein